MALSSSWAAKGVVVTVPVLVLSASAAAIFLFFLLSSLSSSSSSICTCPVPSAAVSTTPVGGAAYGRFGARISPTEEDVKWVKDQIEANGLHMQDNILRKGINPRTRAQQLQDLIQTAEFSDSRAYPIMKESNQAITQHYRAPVSYLSRSITATMGSPGLEDETCLNSLQILSTSLQMLVFLRLDAAPFESACISSGT